MKQLLIVAAAAGVMASAAGAQGFERRANITGGGGPDRGKCTIEVVVDGIAEVEIRGDFGIIRNIAGQPAQWRRFQCSSPLPRNPAGFRFQGIDGRGRQDLIRDPHNGGSAVVRIEDSKGGSEGYTFDLIWGGGEMRQPDRFPERVPERYSDRQPSRRFTTEQAIEVCKDGVRRQAGGRWEGRRVEFLDMRLDDNPGRNDYILGRAESHGPGGVERFRFSCSVNFDSGNVRSVQLDPVYEERGPSRRFTTEHAVNACRDSVRRLAAERYRGFRVDFINTRMDDNPGRNDWVVGAVDLFTGRGDFEGRFRFSCSVNFDTGQVRSADIERARRERNWRDWR